MKKVLNYVAATICGLVCMTANVQAEVQDSSTFAYQYNGNEIHDGTAAISPWAIAGGIEDDDITLDGTSLVITPLSGADAEDNNGWIQQDGGTTPWEAAVEKSQWTVEISVDLNDNDLERNDNIVLWAEGGGNRQIIIIGADNVSTFGGTVLDSNDNTDGQHVFQLQFDGDDASFEGGTYSLYRDGASLGTLGRESAQGLSRLIVGDCCTNPLGNPVDQYAIGYVRFHAVPEPTALALGALGLLGMAGLRRRR